MKGAVIFLKVSAATLSPFFWMGVSYFSRNSWALGKKPRFAKSMMVQNSMRRFSTGVPLMAIFTGACRLRKSLLWSLSAFLMFWASSMTTACQVAAFKISKSLRKVA